MTFEAKLRAFFKKHDPGREYLAPRIAKQFIRNKDVAMAHLYKRYANGGIQFKGYNSASKQLEAPIAAVGDISTEVEEELTEFAADAEAIVEGAEDVAQDAVEGVENMVDDLAEDAGSMAEDALEDAEDFIKGGEE